MPYTLSNAPAQVQNLPDGAKKIWISTFNAVYENTNSEDAARQAAWRNVKEKYKKVDGKWTKKKLNFYQKIDQEYDMKKSAISNEIAQSILNNTPDSGFFKAFIPLQINKDNNTQIFYKELEGKKLPYLLGEGSNTKVDKGDDRMSKAFVSKMKDQLVGLNVFVEHEYDIEKTVGFVSDTGGSSDSVMVETSLEPEEQNPLVKKIIQKMNHGIKIYYSVAGKITKAIRKFDGELNKTVREIEDGIIYEISLTALPEGEVGMATAMYKSLHGFLKKVGKDEDFSEEEINTFIKSSVKEQSSEDTGEGVETDFKSYEDLKKAIDELMQTNGIDDQIYDAFNAFRQLIWRITYSNDLTPEEKKNKINEISAEYSLKVEELTANFADLQQKLENQLGMSV